MSRSLRVPALLLALANLAGAQTSKQPKVAPGPNEPDWSVVLETKYELSMFGDLLNPLITTPEATPSLFKKAGPGPVIFTPVIALGLETINRGGWYTPTADASRPDKHELWSYKFKNTTDDVKTGKNLPPPLADRSITTFDPGDRPFGLWVSNDGLKDGGVFSEPKAVAAINARLVKQPYKLMIYPYKDKATGKLLPNSYLLGWEYSTSVVFEISYPSGRMVILTFTPCFKGFSRWMPLSWSFPTSGSARRSSPRGIPSVARRTKPTTSVTGTA